MEPLGSTFWILPEFWVLEIQELFLVSCLDEPLKDRTWRIKRSPPYSDKPVFVVQLAGNPQSFLIPIPTFRNWINFKLYL